MRPSPYLKNIDQTELESRFSNEQGINYKDIRSSNITFDDILPYLELLPNREKDLLELYYKYQKNQKDIAKMFGVTQGAVSSRITRARNRLEFLKDMPKINRKSLDKDLGSLFGVIEMEIIKTMSRTTCQSRTAELVNEKFSLRGKNRMTQVKVRHRFEKCIKFLSSMKKTKSEFSEYHRFLTHIKNNLYKLHEVKLPHFDRGKSAVFSLV